MSRHRSLQVPIHGDLCMELTRRLFAALVDQDLPNGDLGLKSRLERPLTTRLGWVLFGRLGMDIDRPHWDEADDPPQHEEPA